MRCDECIARGGAVGVLRVPRVAQREHGLMRIDHRAAQVLNVCVGDTVTPPATGFPAGGQTFPFTSMVVSSVKWTIP